jgi:hypothetical protein
VGAYLAHEISEALDLTEEGGVLQVPENLLAVAHGSGVAQVAEQNPRDEVTLLAITHDRRHHLVEVQIRREGAIFVLPPGVPGPRRLPGQQAGEVTTTFSR